MAQNKAGTVLRRMTGSGRPDPDHGVVTLAGSMRLAASRAGHEELRLRLLGGEVTETRLTVGGLDDALPDRGLLMFLRGRGGACGIAALDRALAASVLEARTTGAVTPGPVPDRAPTQTDATLVRGFLGAFLAELSERLDGRAGLAWAAGFQPRERVPDPDRLRYLMPDIAYRALTVDIDVGRGVRHGKLTLILPREETAAMPEKWFDRAPDGASWGATFTSRALTGTAQLDAVLCHLRVPLGEVEALEPGSLLRIPRDSLARITLTAADGTRAAGARLGQSGGKRAVKVNAAAGTNHGEDVPHVSASALDHIPAGQPPSELPSVKAANTHTA